MNVQIDQWNKLENSKIDPNTYWKGGISKQWIKDRLFKKKFFKDFKKYKFKMCNRSFLMNVKKNNSKPINKTKKIAAFFKD